MSKIKICALFRPLNTKERADHGDGTCIQRINSESFIIKDEKEQFEFSFDKVFYPGSEQADVYEFLARPIVQGAVNGRNGAIITYGQTGAGKTYCMEGPGIMVSDEQNRGLLPRVLEELFEAMEFTDGMTSITIKLSMVEIYMERIRDLFDLSKDNIQIKESKSQEIYLSGVTEVDVTNPAEALRHLHNGIANRAVGETQMNMASSRSHCIYIVTIRQEAAEDKRKKKSGRLMLVDLAGSEKVEKTGAEGRVLDEAKTINKSLSALGNVINALTGTPQGKSNHVPFRDSKLTRILQDALRGNSQTALLCCCSPSPLNTPESLSSLRFGARAKHIKETVSVACQEDTGTRKQEYMVPNMHESRERILSKLSMSLKAEDVKLLDELFTLEGIFCDIDSAEIECDLEDVTSRTIYSLHNAVEMLNLKVEELMQQNAALRARLKAAETQAKKAHKHGGKYTNSFPVIVPSRILRFLSGPYLGIWVNERAMAPS